VIAVRMVQVAINEIIDAVSPWFLTCPKNFPQGIAGFQCAMVVWPAITVTFNPSGLPTAALVLLSNCALRVSPMVLVAREGRIWHRKYTVVGHWQTA
jgi:hypothetical protein